MKPIKRGDIYFASLNPVVGSEQGEARPVLIVSNDLGNRYSPTVVAVPLTCKLKKNSLPTHVHIGKRGDLEHDSLALAEQIRTIDRSRLSRYIGRISKNEQSAVDLALAICIGIDKRFPTNGDSLELWLCLCCEDNFKKGNRIFIRKGCRTDSGNFVVPKLRQDEIFEITRAESSG